MTANQIAAEANAIRKEELEEAKRHNQASESNDYTRNAITEEYNHRVNDLKNQELFLMNELKRLELEINKALGEEKNRLQAQYNSIQQQLADVRELEVSTDKQYKETMGLVETERSDEVIRHNLQSESISEKANTIKEHEVDITERESSSRISLNQAKTKQIRGTKSGILGDLFTHGEDYVKSENAKKSAKVEITGSNKHDKSFSGTSGKF